MKHESGTWGTCASNCPKKEWCARLYSGNYRNGQVQEISDSEAGFTSTRFDVSSIKIKDRCMLKLFSNNEALLLDGDQVSNIDNFNDMSQVIEAQCSCFPLNSGDYTSNGIEVTNNAGTALVTYNQRPGRYRRNCTWKPRRFGKWRCVPNGGRGRRSLQGKKNAS